MTAIGNISGKYALKQPTQLQNSKAVSQDEELTLKLVEMPVSHLPRPLSKTSKTSKTNNVSISLGSSSSEPPMTSTDMGGIISILRGGAKRRGNARDTAQPERHDEDETSSTQADLDWFADLCRASAGTTARLDQAASDLLEQGEQRFGDPVALYYALWLAKDSAQPNAVLQKAIAQQEANHGNLIEIDTATYLGIKDVHEEAKTRVSHHQAAGLIDAVSSYVLDKPDLYSTLKAIVALFPGKSLSTALDMVGKGLHRAISRKSGMSDSRMDIELFNLVRDHRIVQNVVTLRESAIPLLKKFPPTSLSASTR
ncbi:hypothetical protein [Paraburkholderia hayleyella]|uniref:hypothetical protein n=1 Tax=Paraburkholderia hayleyella TaxID=2152889 RepID=UPI001291091D|nr:hypothetical protein [Paraburkholderia hayleyella]